jgi:RNA polymerase sigma-70 factor (ECF subfamily)
MVKNTGYADVDISLLIEKSQQGNRQAQFEIYSRYSKAMYNTCLRMLNNAFDAEDAMQEAFISAFSNIRNYTGNVTFGAWLKKIIVNKCIDFIRAKKTYAQVLTQMKSETEISADAEEQGENIKADANQIKHKINELPDGYRIILSLYLIEGYDHEEIAQILDISSSTSRSQYVRAKKKLIEMLNR